MTCDNCGKHFDVGDRPGGIPNGVSMVTDTGKFTLCADCIMDLGEMDDAEKDAFFQRLTGEKN